MFKKVLFLACIAVFCLGNDGPEQDAVEIKMQDSVQDAKMQQKLTEDEIKKRQEEMLKIADEEGKKEEQFVGTFGFYGIGAGGFSNNFYCPESFCAVEANKKSTLLMVESQIGAVTMFSKYFGVQYYFEAEVGIPSKSNYLDGLLLTTGTVNADLVAYAYRSKKVSLGFFAGVGVGYDFLFGKAYDYYDYATSTTKSRYEHISDNLVSKANLGLRFLTSDNIGVDIFFKLPFNEVKIANTGAAIKDRTAFGIRFVVLFGLK